MFIVFSLKSAAGFPQCTHILFSIPEMQSLVSGLIQRSGTSNDWLYKLNASKHGGIQADVKFILERG